MMFQPKRRRRIPARIFPSIKRVTKPHTHEVTGMIAKITLTR